MHNLNCVRVYLLQMDPHPDEEWKRFCNFEDETLDSKLFSPLHLQMQAELGSSGIYYSDSNYLNCGANAGHIQSGTKESDAYISQFIESVLNSSEDYSFEDFQQETMSQSEFLDNTVASSDNGFYGEVEAENAKAVVSETFLAGFFF